MEAHPEEDPLPNTTEIPEDNPEDPFDAPRTREEIIESLREKFEGWDDPANQGMTEERFEELAALSLAERTKQAAPDELAEYEQLAETTAKFGGRLASLYSKPALTGFDTSAIGRLLGRNSAFEGLAASFAKPAFTGLNPASSYLGATSITRGLVDSYLTTPKYMSAFQTLSFRSPVLAGPAMESFTRSIFADSGWGTASKLLDTSALASPHTSDLQQIVTQISAPTAARMISSSPSLVNVMNDITRHWWATADLDDVDTDAEAPELAEVTPDEQTIEQAWQDIERVLRSDKQLRRSVKSGAKQLSQQAKIGRKPAARILIMMIIVWLCAVAVPWTDGERKVDDITVPVGLLAAEYLAYLKVAPKSRPNLLQKNGPRRRRHRRSNH